MLESIKEELNLLKGIGWWYLAILFVPILRKTVFNRARAMDAYDVVDGSASVAIVFTIITLYIVWTKWNDIKSYLDSCKYFINYYIFCIFSIAWAGISNAPLIGFRALEVIASFLFIALIFAKAENIRDCLRIVLILLLMSNCLFLVYMHHHDNTFPLLAVAQLLLSLGAIKYKIFSYKQMVHHILIAITTLGFATSSASWLSLIIGLFFFYGTQRNGVKFSSLIIIAILFYFVWNTFSSNISTLIFGNKTEEMIMNGSGRQGLWEAYINGWKESPLLGYGFIVGEKGAIAAKYVLFATNTSHNMLISVLINTGIVGMVLWVFFMWKLCRICWENTKESNPYALICFPAIISVLINSTSFPVIGTEWSPVSPPIYALIIFVFYHICNYQNEEYCIE